MSFHGTDLETACRETRAAFSPYLDGAITGREMQTIAAHLAACPACTEEFASWRGMQRLLAQAGRAKVPTDLGLQLRLAISHESTRRQTRRHALSTRWDNIIRPMMLQAASGLACTLLLVGGIATLIGVVVPGAVLANDEPLGAITRPHYLYSAAQQQPVSTPGDATIVVEAEVNADGKVSDWKIVSGAADAATRNQLRNQLMLQVYEPASMFGAPIRGKVLVTFSGIQVRG